MSFVTLIRDYVETLNTLSQSVGSDLTANQFVSETFLYVLQTIKTGLFYVLSFQWIRDFTLLPIVLPTISTSILKETFFLETPSQVFFDFLEIPDLHENKFLLGFLNSFFLSLPLSIVSIIAIRRLLIQGIPSAVYTISGYLIGQVVFLGCTIFGIRQILIPWLTLEPLSYVVGLIIVFRLIYSMTNEFLKPLNGWFLPQYKWYFLSSFVLAWCDHTSIFQYLGNIAASSNVTWLENFSSSTSVSSFLNHFIYLVGILVGSGFFTALWGIFFLQVKNWCISYTPLFLSSFIQLINKTSFVIVLALSLTSIPFYAYDYLLTGPLGFVSQDSLFQQTLFEQRNEQIKAYNPQLSDRETNFKYLHIDVSPFDRGDYLVYSSSDSPLSFEELNYRGEYDWTNRINQLNSVESRSSFFSLSKILKKQKKPASIPTVQTQMSQLEQQNSFFSEKDGVSKLPSWQGFEAGDFEGDLTQEGWERFNENYIAGTPDMIYQQLYNSSFPRDFLRTEARVHQDIEQQFKQKYYSNPIYKGLLTLDIDLFLKRQPKSFQLSGQHQADLYQKRQSLESYFNSIREYSNLPYSEAFDLVFDGARSFSNKAYNQQFKGTWRSIRRLFALTPTENNKATILTFDQPLYQSSENQSSLYHEELGTVVDKDQISSQNSNIVKTTDFVNKPLYAGWDEKGRKFVITNKLLSRRFAGHKIKIEPEMKKKFSRNESKQAEGKLEFKFTTWPLKSPETQPNISSQTLYKPADENILKLFGWDVNERFPYTQLPANVERYKRFSQQENPPKDYAERYYPEILAPKRGGFIWPGTSNFSFPNLFSAS